MSKIGREEREKRIKNMKYGVCQGLNTETNLECTWGNIFRELVQRFHHTLGNRLNCNELTNLYRYNHSRFRNSRAWPRYNHHYHKLIKLGGKYIKFHATFTK